MSDQTFKTVADALLEGFFVGNPHRPIFDVRYNIAKDSYGKEKYIESRIPHAIFVDMDGELALSPGANGRHPLPSAENFVTEFCQKKHNLGSLASSQDKLKVLCYDDFCGGFAAARFWWMLHNLGIEVYILNGGFQSFYLEPDPTTKVYRQVEQGEKGAHVSLEMKGVTGANYLPWPFRSAWQCVLELPELEDYIRKGGISVDARPAVRFCSTIRAFPPDNIPGHIPGARNVPMPAGMKSVKATAPSSSTGPARTYNGSVSYNVIKPSDELRAGFEKILPSGQKDCSSLVFSCGSGVTACFNIAASIYCSMGEPSVYMNSFSQYQSARGREMELAMLYEKDYAASNSVKKHPHIRYFLKMLKSLPPPVQAAELSPQLTVNGVAGWQPNDITNLFTSHIEKDGHVMESGIEHKASFAKEHLESVAMAVEDSRQHVQAGEVYTVVVAIPGVIAQKDERILVHVEAY